MSPGPRQNLRVILVQPSTHHGVESLFTFHKNEGLGQKMPLGIVTLATYLIEQGFENTRCLDAQLEDLSPEQTAARLAAWKPDIVGISAWTAFWYPTFKTIQLTRKQLPDCTIVVGGPHCLVYPGETLAYSDADYVVAGDGEDTLLSLLSRLQSGEPVGDLPGLWRKEGAEIIAPTTPIAVVDDLDKIPNPDRTLLPYKRYDSILNPRAYETTVMTSRGCPYRCVFCKIHAQKVHARSARRVVDEFREVAALGISDVQVYDDTFTWSKKRVIDICHGILDNGLKVRWAIRERVNKADPEVYRLLKKAGCYRIHFGVESGCERILKASGKRITLAEAEYALALAKRMGFTTLAYYMFGFLDETCADALETLRFALRTDVDYATFSVLIPYPGTTLYSTALDRQILPYDFWSEFARSPVPDFCIPHLIEQHMDRRTLLRLRDRAQRRFYFRPARVLKEIANLRSWRELRRKARMAATIVRDSLSSYERPRGLKPGTS